MRVLTVRHIFNSCIDDVTENYIVMVVTLLVVIMVKWSGEYGGDSDDNGPMANYTW